MQFLKIGYLVGVDQNLVSGHFSRWGNQQIFDWWRGDSPYISHQKRTLLGSPKWYFSFGKHSFISSCKKRSHENWDCCLYLIGYTSYIGKFLFSHYRLSTIQIPNSLISNISLLNRWISSICYIVANNNYLMMIIFKPVFFIGCVDPVKVCSQVWFMLLKVLPPTLGIKDTMSLRLSYDGILLKMLVMY